jgi:eukaryotic-like serine/threonine-protein kinase
MQFRRPSGATPHLPFLRTMAGRRSVKQAAIIMTAFALGYLITVFWLFPAPFFSSRHSVPRLIDLGVTEARQKLEAAGLRFRLDDQETDPVVPRNAVVRQDPPPGVVVEPNTVVSLVLSDGPPDVPVPDVAGFPRALAERVLKAAGFRLGRIDTLPSANDRGIVVQTRPGPGVGRSAGTSIELVVSSGKADVTVPSMVGLTLVEARARLAEIGLLVGSVSRRPAPGRPEGTILEQRPTAGTRSGRGTRVDLIVAVKS